MGDVAGPLGLPAPNSDTPLGDPLLRTLVDFLAAVINDQCGTAWQTVDPGSGTTVVTSTFTHDPVEVEFIDKQLPGLFLWRGEVGEARWIGQDYLVRPSTLQLALVMRPTAQQRQKLRESFVNAAMSALELALEHQARTPSWIAAGDTDPLAVTRGSLLWTFLSAHSLKLGRGAMRPLIIREMQPKTDRSGAIGHVVGVYRAITAQLRLEERIVFDAATHAEPFAYAEVTAKNPDDPAPGIQTSQGRFTGS